MRPNEQKAIDKLNETYYAVSLKPADAMPDRLYHYTSASGFYGIVSSGTLRAGNFSYLNDSSEIQYGRRIVQTVIREYLESTQSPAQREVFARARRTFDDIGPGLEFYLFCFCTKSDRLSQWRAYGSAKGRFCIGFDTENLFTLELSYQLSRVLYDPAEQRRKVKRAIDSAVEALAAGCSPDFIDRVHDLFCRKVTRELSFFKDQGFKEEDEWRAVHPSERVNQGGRRSKLSKFLLETVPKKTENSIVKNQRKSKSLIFTGSKIFAGQ